MPFFTRTPYRKAITLAVTLKIAGLILLWTFFFSHPAPHFSEVEMMQRLGMTK